MKIYLKIVLLFFLGASALLYADSKDFHYQRDIDGVSQTWHRLELPVEIFSKLKSDLSDIRIYARASNQNAGEQVVDENRIEVPYILNIKKPRSVIKKVNFNIMNQTRVDDVYYYSFEVSERQFLNEINLDFTRSNYEFRVQLEGSQNQQQWFSIVDDYRILSIKNKQTDFNFSSVNFPKTNYKFYRVSLKSSEDPQLKIVSAAQTQKFEAQLTAYAVDKMQVVENEELKRTEITINLKEFVPVSYFKINIDASFDYQRSMKLQYLSQQENADKKLKDIYSTLVSDSLSSAKDNEFIFDAKNIKTLRVLIYNQDNQALAINSVGVKAFVYELIARFPEAPSYYLNYGNSDALKANYDIAKFSDKIPSNISEVSLKEERKIASSFKPELEPLFKNKLWLWLLMLLIIVLLGGFSLKMIRDKG